MYLFCRLKPTSFWWLTVQLMWSCWCLRGCQDRHTTTHVPRGITVPPPLSASASTSKRRSFDKTVVKTRSCYTELVDSFFKTFFCTHSLEQTEWHFDQMKELFGDPMFSRLFLQPAGYCTPAAVFMPAPRLHHLDLCPFGPNNHCILPNTVTLRTHWGLLRLL